MWKRTPWRGAHTAVAGFGLVVVAVAVVSTTGGTPRSDEQPGGADQTTIVSTTVPPVAASSTSTPQTSAPASSVELVAGTTGFGREAFEDARWIVGTAEGFENNLGEVVLDDHPVGPGGAIARTQDGTVFMVLNDRIMSWAFGSASPREVEIDQFVYAIRVTADHDIVAFGDDTISLISQTPVDFQHTFGDLTLTATNGLSVRTVQPLIEPDGYTVDKPGYLELFDANGALVRTWPIGSSTSPYLELDDFDGRTILLSRRPGEPLFPIIEYIVIDTQCGACLESFRGAPGLASLAGPDVETVFSSFDVDDLELCSTWRDQPDIATPPGLPDDVRDQFERLTNASARCDLRPFRFMPEPLEHADSYRWNLLREVLQSTPTAIDGEWTWVSVDSASRESWVRMLEFGEFRISLETEFAG
ncbi:MAG: hypothetical protein GXP35_10930 [Actinobacteria bacterium]|nr:hypothetical protein [Actinomycetota bacterium]